MELSKSKWARLKRNWKNSIKLKKKIWLISLVTNLEMSWTKLSNLKRKKINWNKNSRKKEKLCKVDLTYLRAKLNIKSKKWQKKWK